MRMIAWLYAFLHMLLAQEYAQCVPVWASEETWPEFVGAASPIPLRYGEEQPAVFCRAKTDWYVCAQGHGRI